MASACVRCADVTAAVSRVALAGLRRHSGDRKECVGHEDSDEGILARALPKLRECCNTRSWGSCMESAVARRGERWGASNRGQGRVVF